MFTPRQDEHESSRVSHTPHAYCFSLRRETLATSSKSIPCEHFHLCDKVSPCRNVTSRMRPPYRPPGSTTHSGRKREPGEFIFRATWEQEFRALLFFLFLFSLSAACMLSTARAMSAWIRLHMVMSAHFRRCGLPADNVCVVRKSIVSGTEPFFRARHSCAYAPRNEGALYLIECAAGYRLMRYY